MERNLELDISEAFMKSKVKEFEERISDNMVGKLSKMLNDIKIKRDKEIEDAIDKIMEKYSSEITSINRKILAKAKLLEV